MNTIRRRGVFTPGRAPQEVADHPAHAAVTATAGHNIVARAEARAVQGRAERTPKFLHTNSPAVEEERFHVEKILQVRLLDQLGYTQLQKDLTCRGGACTVHDCAQQAREENINMKLNKNNLLIHRVAEKDGGRYGMSGVRVEPHCTVATDGVQLVAVGLPAQEYESEGTAEPFTLTKSAAETAEKLTTARATEITLSGDHKLVAAKGTVEAEKVEGAFPDWKRILPTDHGDGFTVAFDPAKLAGLMDVFKRLGVKNARLSFAPTKGEDKAMRVDGITEEGQKVTALLMPMRDTKGCVPLHEWEVQAEPVEAVEPVEPVEKLAEPVEAA